TRNQPDDPTRSRFDGKMRGARSRPNVEVAKLWFHGLDPPALRLRTEKWQARRPGSGECSHGYCACSIRGGIRRSARPPSRSQNTLHSPSKPDYDDSAFRAERDWISHNAQTRPLPERPEHASTWPARFPHRGAELRPVVAA